MQMGQFEVILFGILGVGFLGALCYLVYIAFIRYRAHQTLLRRRLFLAEMRKLPVYRWSDYHNFTDTCCSCYETFQASVGLTLFPCLHACHLTCAEDWILRGNLRCPMCSGEIIPNSRIFTESDILAPPESALPGTTRGELTPLLRPSLFQEVSDDDEPPGLFRVEPERDDDEDD